MWDNVETPRSICVVLKTVDWLKNLPGATEGRGPFAHIAVLVEVFTRFPMNPPTDNSVKIAQGATERNHANIKEGHSSTHFLKG